MILFIEILSETLHNNPNLEISVMWNCLDFLEEDES